MEAVELPALTSLRGIAALTVVVYHSSFLACNVAGGGPPFFWRRGYLAVDLFFFLSGFVLTHVYRGRLAHGRNWGRIGRFLWARFARIYPASLFVTAIYVVCHCFGRLALATGISFKTQLIAALTLTQVPWLRSIAINDPSWSISAEWYAYLIFPFAVPLILRLDRRATAALVAGLLAAATVDQVIGGQQTSGWLALFRALPEFFGGVLVYRAYRAGVCGAVWQEDATLLGVAATMIVAFWADFPDGLIVLLLPALLLAAVSNKGRLRFFLDIAPLRWLGDISYSLYIFQTVPFMVLTAISPVLTAHGFDGVRFEALAALSALAGGILVHRTVDLPARLALRRLPDGVATVIARTVPSRFAPAATASSRIAMRRGS
ncbi:MAG TPA: acyltransferase [Stellaceae bacterium]|nr:acyltransferase [Stellaceae bacterium]